MAAGRPAPSQTAGFGTGLGSRVDLNWEDRKSTRLNSSHMSISYAVFCLKKKKTDSNTKNRPLNTRYEKNKEPTTRHSEIKTTKTDINITPTHHNIQTHASQPLTVTTRSE